jgi:hypothetical protein
VELKALVDGAVDYSMFAFDSLDLTYVRSTDVAGDQLELRASANGPIQVTALSSADAWAFDVTDPRVPVIVSTTASGGSPRAAWVKFMGTAGDEYLVSTLSGALRPQAVTAVADSGLTAGGIGADYVIITTDALYDAASQIAAYRAGQGLKTKVVTMAQIYDAFSFGVSNPHAIQSFLAYALSKWRPRPQFVLLAGEGSYDYKNFAGNNDCLVPPLLVDTEYGLAASDVLLADVQGPDGVPDVAIGRIPTLDSAGLYNALNKIQAYEAAGNGDWQRSALFAADNADGGGNFPANSDRLVDQLSSTVNVKKAYLGDLTVDAARNLLLNAFGGSSLFVNYVGHGGPAQLADELLLQNDDVDALPPASTLPIVTAFTCLVSNFGMPGYDSLGEHLLERVGAGAIAVWGPSAMEDDDYSTRLGGSFMSNLFSTSHSETLGGTIQAAMRSAKNAGVSTTSLWTYNLLGDPALEVR